MGWLTGLYVTLGLLGIILFLRKILHQQRYYQLARKIPGPKPLPIVGNMHLLVNHIDRIPYRMLEILDEYNGTAGLWVGNKLVVYLSNPEDLEVYFKNSKMLDRPFFYGYLKMGMGDCLFIKNGDNWKKSRKMITPAFHSNLVKENVPVFVKHSNVMVEVLQKEVGKPAFNSWEYTRSVTMDMIFETAFGHDLQMQYRNLRIFDHVERIMKLVYDRGHNIFLHPDFIYNKSSNKKKYVESARTFRPYFEKMVDDGLAGKWNEEPKPDEKDEVPLLIRQLVAFGLTRNEILDEIVGVATTGYDTTSHTLGFILMMLGIHQDVQDKVYEEDQIVQSIVSGREMISDDLQHYLYLERVIKETLRLYPVGPFIFREATEEVQFPNFIVPKGTMVGCAMLRTHRDPLLYEDPLTFNPDNFLPEKTKDRHPYAFMPFSSGPRGCIGMKYGMMSMKVILSTLVRNYRIICDKTMDDIVLKAEITMRSEGGYPIRLENRNVKNMKNV